MSGEATRKFTKAAQLSIQQFEEYTKTDKPIQYILRTANEDEALDKSFAFGDTVMKTSDLDLYGLYRYRQWGSERVQYVLIVEKMNSELSFVHKVYEVNAD